MENQNILTIKFNTLDDLAVQVADWHELLNHECCGNCKEEMLATEAAENASDKNTASVAGTITNQNKDDVPVQPLDAEPEPQSEVVEDKEKPVQEAADTLDVTAEPVDKKAFYAEFREWMGRDIAKAKKAKAIFSKHGVSRPSSDGLTDDIITDLKSIMAEEA